jgi:acyl-CoA synthetase (AMP-forming)/AMP-acid ligase II
MGREYPTAARTVSDVIRYWAHAAPDASAIAALDRRDMSYRELMALMDRMARQLAKAGFGPKQSPRRRASGRCRDDGDDSRHRKLRDCRAGE